LVGICLASCCSFSFFSPAAAVEMPETDERTREKEKKDVFIYLCVCVREPPSFFIFIFFYSHRASSRAFFFFFSRQSGVGGGFSLLASGALCTTHVHMRAPLIIKRQSLSLSHPLVVVVVDVYLSKREKEGGREGKLTKRTRRCIKI